MLEIGGGLPGEHTASLYSACARPFHSAFGEYVYKTPVERAAALFHAISLESPPSALQVRLLGEVALETASGNLTVEQVTHWIERIFAP